MVAKVDNAHSMAFLGMQDGGQCGARTACSCVVSGVVRPLQGQRSQVGVSRRLERLTCRRWKMVSMEQTWAFRLRQKRSALEAFTRPWPQSNPPTQAAKLTADVLPPPSTSIVISGLHLTTASCLPSYWLAPNTAILPAIHTLLPQLPEAAIDQGILISIHNFGSKDRERTAL